MRRRTEHELRPLLKKLRGLPSETEWVEFKHNKDDGPMIGDRLSALSNSARLLGQESGFIVWGIEDGTHELVGTTFRPRQAKNGNEELENWLLRGLNPRVDVQIYEWSEDGNPVVMFEVQPAQTQPVAFSGVEFIRVGSLTKKLKDYPNKEAELWRLFSQTTFEDGVALAGATTDDVLKLIDYTGCFALLRYPLPDNRAGIFERLTREQVIRPVDEGRYDITNIGALLFAADLEKFEGLSRKALRVVQYEGRDRTKRQREQEGALGYAIGFYGLIEYINALLPHSEEIGRAFRVERPMYPEIAIRELAVNALIHQDFLMTGTGPMVEIFEDRIEFTNPGVPLIDTMRFLDVPPQSRNEWLAKLMRRMNICEELGTGIDKVITAVELFQLPPPSFVAKPKHTQVTLFAPKSPADMNREEKIRACYQHACLRHLIGDAMSNESLRERLGIEKQNYAIASRIIRDAVEVGVVEPVDPNAGKRYMRYQPFWAGEGHSV